MADNCAACAGTLVIPCEACNGTGAREALAPSGRDVELRCDHCHGEGKQRCSCTVPTAPRSSPVNSPALDRAVTWAASPRRGQRDPADLWGAGPFYEYEAVVDGQRWEVARVGDVIEWYRLYVDGVGMCEFSPALWPGCWKR